VRANFWQIAADWAAQPDRLWQINGITPVFNIGAMPVCKSGGGADAVLPLQNGWFYRDPNYRYNKNAVSLSAGPPMAGRYT
tara:strand:+ start:2638 stop:2880 length:243 start_codon:yes stop_codon:yes gene_type:complete